MLALQGTVEEQEVAAAVVADNEIVGETMRN